MLDEHEFMLFRRACKAYQAHCRRSGSIFCYPAKASTEFDYQGSRVTVTLRNVSGELYTYRPRVAA